MKNIDRCNDSIGTAFIAAVEVGSSLMLHNNVLEDDTALHNICQVVMIPDWGWTGNDGKVSLKDPKSTLHIFPLCFSPFHKIIMIWTFGLRVSLHKDSPVWIDAVHKEGSLCVGVSIEGILTFRSRSVQKVVEERWLIEQINVVVQAWQDSHIVWCHSFKNHCWWLFRTTLGKLVKFHRFNSPWLTFPLPWNCLAQAEGWFSIENACSQ